MLDRRVKAASDIHLGKVANDIEFDPDNRYL